MGSVDLSGVPRRSFSGYTGFYDYDGKTPLSLNEWGRKLERLDRNRVVKQERFYGRFISTVWIGLDMGFDPYGPPLIYETMIFAKDVDEAMDRYHNRAQAEAGHKRMARMYLHKTAHRAAVLGSLFLFAVLYVLMARVS